MRRNVPLTLIIDRTVSAELFAPMRIWLVQGGNPRGVLVKGASQSDMARELGVSRAAVSKQLSTAVRKIRAAIRDESKETKNTTTSSVCERKEH